MTSLCFMKMEQTSQLAQSPMSPCFVHSPNEKEECPFMDTIHKYMRIKKIGQGTYGEVFKARHKITGQFVAMKRIMMENEREGFPITALREIKILQMLKHENVVRLVEICSADDPKDPRLSQFYMVTEFCEHDLAGLINNPEVRFRLAEIKKIMHQIFNGLFILHTSKILHRDMKAANILVTKHGIVKLADFGLARSYVCRGQRQLYTSRVVTLWYRPPELLFGDKDYTAKIDTWGAGCVMAELWTRIPILQGQTEQHQINLISQLCGSFNPEYWASNAKYPLFNQLQLKHGLMRKVKYRLRDFVKDQSALDLIDKLLILDPVNRYDSDMALNHGFFWNDPAPEDISGTLSRLESKSDYARYASAGRSAVHLHNPDQHIERVF